MEASNPSPTGAWSRVTSSPFDGFLLPIAAVGLPAFAVLLVALVSGSLVAFPPEVLTILTMGTLVNVLAVAHLQHENTGGSPRSPSRRLPEKGDRTAVALAAPRATPSPALRSHHLPRPRLPHLGQVVRRAHGDPGSRVGGSARLRGSSLPAGPDEVWAEFSPGPVGQLPVELIAPVKEWVDLNYDVVDRSNPPRGSLGIAGDPFIERASLTSMTDLQEQLRPPSGSVPAPASPTLHSVDVEATLATPPHLRFVPTVTTTTSSLASPGSHVATVPDPACASCSSVLEEVVQWRRCTQCHRPLCSDCVIEALVGRGRGWCTTCALLDAGEPGVRSPPDPAGGPHLDPDLDLTPMDGHTPL